MSYSATIGLDKHVCLKCTLSVVEALRISMEFSVLCLQSMGSKILGCFAESCQLVPVLHRYFIPIPVFSALTLHERILVVIIARGGVGPSRNNSSLPPYFLV